MVIKTCIHPLWIELRQFDAANPGSFGNTAFPNFRCFIGPGFTAISRYLQVAVICSYPDHVLIVCLLRYGKNGTMVFGRCIISCDTAALFGFLFCGIIGSQVGRNTGPVASLVV